VHLHLKPEPTSLLFTPTIFPFPYSTPVRIVSSANHFLWFAEAKNLKSHRKCRVLVDVLIVAASAIKQQLAQKQVHLPAITAVSRAMSPVTARWKPRLNLATSVARKVIFLVTAPRRAIQGAMAEAEEAEAEEPRQVANATAVANQATLRVHAPSLQMAAEDTVEVEVEVEGTAVVGMVADSVEERLAMLAAA
jgi:hypothetical protein